MPRLPRHKHFWLGSFLLWFGVLWILSSFSNAGAYTPPVSHFDKVEHFGFFFGGSGLLAAYLYRRKPNSPKWKAIIGTTLVVFCFVAWLDEYHQTFTPNRSGNDIYDGIADMLGATTGAFTLKRFHHLLK